jgi:hypothetical protein
MAKGGGKKKGKKDEATEPEHDKRWERVRVRSARDDAKQHRAQVSLPNHRLQGRLQVSHALFCG